tara:strand:- start:125 stop:424 length:300 start_codon:yes stop_codon:yes gene_type:complete
MPTITLSHLRIIALLEGISYLFLVFVGMPLKYGLDMLIPNKVLGISHGILTVIFCFILVYLWQQKKINSTLSVFVFIASLIPFGAFIADSKLVKLTQSY